MPIEIDGLQGVLERLGALDDESRIKGALESAALHVEGEARKKAPKSIQGTIDSTVEGLQGIVFTPLYYAPYVEYGTGLFSEHPNGGRKNVPWVYVSGNDSNSSSTKTYTEQEARQTVAFLRSKGLDAHMTSGQKPRPYMRPALDESRERIKEILMEEVLKDG